MYIVVCKVVFQFTFWRHFAIKLQNHEVKDYVFGSKISKREGRPIRNQNFYAAIERHHMEKFSVIHQRYKPKYAKFLANFRILFVKKLLAQTHPRGAIQCISKCWSSSTKCNIFRWECPAAPNVWASKKVHSERVKTKVLFFAICGPNSSNLIGKYGSDCTFQQSTMSCSNLEIFAIVAKWHTWKQSFLTPKF